jgi:hypothetical protein
VHRGHGRACCWHEPVANDPFQTFSDIDVASDCNRSFPAREEAIQALAKLAPLGRLQPEDIAAAVSTLGGAGWGWINGRQILTISWTSAGRYRASSPSSIRWADKHKLDHGRHHPVNFNPNLTYSTGLSRGAK